MLSRIDRSREKFFSNERGLLKTILSDLYAGFCEVDASDQDIESLGE